jgi:hypothetical protein
MNRTVRRVVRATATAAGVATSFVLPGIALAAPAQPGMAHEQAPDEGVLAAPGASTASPAADLHAFELPTARALQAKHRPHQSDDGQNDLDHPDPAVVDDSDDYHERHNPGYRYYNRSSDDARRDADADQDNGDPHYPSCAPKFERTGDKAFGYNGGGRKHDFNPDSGDYRPKCTGYHAPRGANAYDDDFYTGTTEGHRHDKDYRFTGGLY